MGYQKTRCPRGPEPPPSPPPVPPAPPPSSVRRFGRIAGTRSQFLAGGSVLVVAGAWLYMKTYRDADATFEEYVHKMALRRKDSKVPLSEEDLPKKVLVLPFHRMKLVEKKSNDFYSRLREAGQWDGDDAPFEVSSVFKTKRTCRMPGSER
jgi:hypothetical protein